MSALVLTLRRGVRNAWRGEEEWVEKDGRPPVVYVADGLIRQYPEARRQIRRWGYFQLRRDIYTRAFVYAAWWAWPWLKARDAVMGALYLLHLRGLLHTPGVPENEVARLRDLRVNTPGLVCRAVGHEWSVVLHSPRLRWLGEERGVGRWWATTRICQRCLRNERRD